MIIFRKAVLIIHGFSGGTYDQEILANYLEPNRNLDVYAFTLPGHEKRHFKTVKYSEWISASEKQVQRLIEIGYKDIYLIGHSMGGVIATYLANKYSEVKKLVLLAPAFDYFVSDNGLTMLDRIKNGIDVIKYSSLDEVVTKFLKVSISSLREFVQLVDKHKCDYLDIKIPTLILHGDHDNIVPCKTSIDIYEKLNVSNKKLVVLDNCDHNIFAYNNEKALQEVENFLL